MSGFENFSAEMAQIEREMVRKGIALGIDWTNEAQLRALAREALTHAHEEADSAKHGDIFWGHAKTDFFGLAQLMLKVMKESADYGFLTHGGPAWKAFGKALWVEAEILGLVAPGGS